MIELLIVEDNAIVRQGLVRLFERESGIVVAGEAENGYKALQMLDSGVACNGVG